LTESALVILSGSFAYLIVTAAHFTRPAYLPLTGEWTAQPPANGLAMDWYFRAIVTIVFSVLGAVIGRSRALRGTRASVRHALLWLGVLVLAWAMLFTSLALVQSPRTWQNRNLQRISP
jgi:hypothetical protein